ncbi:hypothetical protein AAE478_005892 [Parahypoxylon ruwenzoriense]
MGRSMDDQRAPGRGKQTTTKPEPFIQSYTKHNRHSKSQPFDADDLRRRLYIVMAEQKKRERLEEEARSARSREQDTPSSRPETGKIDTAATQPGTTKPKASDTSFAARMARGKATAADLLSEESGTNSPEAKIGRPMSKSIQDRLRRKSSPGVMPAVSAVDNPLKAIPSSSTYCYVPQEAAAQFERTTTANSMREKNVAHSLSKTALRFHAEGRPLDRIELDASVTPAQHYAALKRAQSHREVVHGRNRFQDPRPVPDQRSGSSAEESRLQTLYRRYSLPGRRVPGRSERKGSTGSAVENIPENSELLPVAVLDPPPIDEVCSEETLVVDPAMVINDHRVDWTQSDETCEKPKTLKIPLLKKADSIWTLKGRFGNLAKSSHNKQEEKMAVIREKQELGSTSPPSTKFRRLGFLARLRRL